jgi:hypothetical protein
VTQVDIVQRRQNGEDALSSDTRGRNLVDALGTVIDD